jgi:hypothetical protein
MNKIKKSAPIRLAEDSPLAQGLLKMLEHKKLRDRFYEGEISLNELNRLLKEKGINKKYDHPSTV